MSYEIRGIVRKAEQLRDLGYDIFWENIGDPVQKGKKLPKWMKDIIASETLKDASFGYSHSKGLLSTREFLAERNNQKGGAQIGPEDITFFNGLGDAIAKLYQYLLPTARVIGPSPAYSTHSSAEAAHANSHPITYKLDPKNGWMPDLEDLEMKVKYNDSIVGILVINPDNPTGLVYPRKVLEKIVAIARRYNLFLIFDEIYMNIVYGEVETALMSEIVGDVPGISLKGISKELPWPGSRCGWMEYYNRKSDKEFNRLCQTLDNAKMIEVSSTTLPQSIIPKIMSDERYEPFLKVSNSEIRERSKVLEEQLSDVPYIHFNKTNAAFYSTIIFEDGALKEGQSLKVEREDAAGLLQRWLQGVHTLDKIFVYNLLAAKGVCVVPISSFCSDLLGFRMTLLEQDLDRFQGITEKIKEGIVEFCTSV